VTKKYQNEKIDMPDALGIAVPERVSVAMEEIAGSMREGWTAPLACDTITVEVRAVYAN
jgi:hypothetical protein